MLYSQIKLTERIPFDISLPKRPKSFEELTEEELLKIVEKGIKDAEEGKVYTSEQIEEMLKKKYNLK